MEYILTFSNTNFAIQAEQCLLEKQLRVAVLPLPSQIHAGCGICLRIAPDEIRQALEALKERGICESGLFSRTPDANSYSYTEIIDKNIINKDEATR